jgi:hypothetical protein
MKLSEIAEVLQKEFPGQDICFDVKVWTYNHGGINTEITLWDGAVLHKHVKGLSLSEVIAEVHRLRELMRAPLPTWAATTELEV